MLVDALVVKPGSGGIATYTRGVVAGLARREDISVTVVTSQPADFGGIDRVELVAAPQAVQSFARRVLWRELHLPSLLKRARADLLFSTTIELPMRRLRQPTLMVVHDLGPAQSPAVYGWGRWIRYHALLPRSIANADRVVCVSATTEVQLASTISHDREKVRVIGEAGGGPIERIDVATDSQEAFALYVGTLMPHKNVNTLMAAFADAGLADMRLVAVGPATNAELAKFESAADSFGVADRVRHEGFVSRERLEQLYANASCVVLPTINEGFGLPLLESQVRGTPVVASSIPAFREVAAENSVFWVNRPMDPKAWAEAIGRIRSDARLRDEIVCNAIAGNEGVTWDAIAAELARELRELANAGS